MAKCRAGSGRGGRRGREVVAPGEVGIQLLTASQRRATILWSLGDAANDIMNPFSTLSQAFSQPRKRTPASKSTAENDARVHCKCRAGSAGCGAGPCLGGDLLSWSWSCNFREDPRGMGPDHCQPRTLGVRCGSACTCWSFLSA